MLSGWLSTVPPRQRQKRNRDSDNQDRRDTHFHCFFFIFKKQCYALVFYVFSNLFYFVFNVNVLHGFVCSFFPKQR